jgi:hypothetical protein
LSGRKGERQGKAILVIAGHVRTSSEIDNILPSEIESTISAWGRLEPTPEQG